MNGELIRHRVIRIDTTVLSMEHWNIGESSPGNGLFICEAEERARMSGRYKSIITEENNPEDNRDLAND